MDTKLKINLIRTVNVMIVFALLFSFMPPVIQGAFVGWAIMLVLIKSEDNR